MNAPTLTDAVESMTRLNSWVRSPNTNYDWFSRPKSAIYWMKGKLLNAVTNAGVATHRLIVMEVKCRSCDGTGKWISWDYGQTGESCRTCSGTGRHKLWFVETTIDGRIKWHTPCKYGIFVSYPVNLDVKTLGEAHPETDWKPNTPGQPLVPIEVAAALNICEEFLPERPGEQWDNDGGPYDIFFYSLFIGSQPRKCFRCGIEDDKVSRLHCSRNLLAWDASVCTACFSTFGHMSTWSEKEQAYVCPNSVFDAAPFPIELAEQPAVKRWQARHLQYRFEKEEAKRKRK